MIIRVELEDKVYRFESNNPIDISISTRNGNDNPNAFYIPDPEFSPLKVGSFIGSVAEGGSANCEQLVLYPHGNGTHTECVGHISKEKNTINESLKSFLFKAELISISPFLLVNGDYIILKEHIEELIKNINCEALIIRTYPNSDIKKLKNYSGQNPAYMHWNAAKYIREKGIKHILIDLPSIDREEDHGELLAHHQFWNYPTEKKSEKTITEFIFVPAEVKDGLYLLNLQIASLETDASPSKPIIYILTEDEGLLQK